MFLIHTPREHAEVVARAVVGACRLDGWQSPAQPQLLHTLFNRLLGRDLDFETIEPLSAGEVAAKLVSAEDRHRIAKYFQLRSSVGSTPDARRISAKC